MSKTKCPICGKSNRECHTDGTVAVCAAARKYRRAGWDFTRETMGGMKEYVRVPDKPRNQPPEGPTPVRHKLSEVEPKSVRWLWDAHVPKGGITLLAAKMGKGKSLITAALAAPITIGCDWPDGTPNHDGPGSLLFVVVEDPLDTVIRPRLDAAGADPAKCEAITMMRDAEHDRCYLFNIVRDIDELRRTIAEIGDVRAVVIDPAGLFAVGKASKNSTEYNDTYAALAPLAALAQELDIALILVLHHRKGEQDVNALERVMGSSAWTAVARTVWSIFDDPDDDGAGSLILACSKMNVARKPPALRYVIRTADNGAGVVQWVDGNVDMDADGVLRKLAEKQRGKRGPSPMERTEAEKWLRDVLADGPVLSTELERMRKDADISAGTLQRARKAVGVACRPVQEHGRTVWHVYLPEPDGGE